MKLLIPSVCALALLSGCAEDECEPDVTHAFIYRGRYDTAPGYTIRGREQIDVTNLRALAAHRAALRTERAYAGFEAPGYMATTTRQLSPTGLTIYGSTEGASSVATGNITEVAPPVAEYLQGPTRLPGSPTPLLARPLIDRRPIVRPAPPIGTPVPGRPGYVISPFAPDAGYIDVSGLAPGSDAKDPYTGKIFRVP